MSFCKIAMLIVCTNGKQGKCSHKNACWGASPNPALWDSSAQTLLCYFGTKCPEIRTLRCAASPHKAGFVGHPTPKVCCLRHRRSSLLFLIFALIRQSEQMIDIRLDRHDLSHFLLGCPVLGIKSFFPCREFSALFF